MWGGPVGQLASPYLESAPRSLSATASHNVSHTSCIPRLIGSQHVLNNSGDSYVAGAIAGAATQALIVVISQNVAKIHTSRQQRKIKRAPGKQQAPFLTSGLVAPLYTLASLHPIDDAVSEVSGRRFCKRWPLFLGLVPNRKARFIRNLAGSVNARENTRDYATHSSRAHVASFRSCRGCCLGSTRIIRTASDRPRQQTGASMRCGQGVESERGYRARYDRLRRSSERLLAPKARLLAHKIGLTRTERSPH